MQNEKTGQKISNITELIRSAIWRDPGYSSYGRRDQLVPVAYFLLYHRFLKVGYSGPFAAKDQIKGHNDWSFVRFLKHFFGSKLAEARIQIAFSQIEQSAFYNSFASLDLSAEAVSDQEFRQVIERLLLSSFNQHSSVIPLPNELGQLLLGLFDLPPNPTVYNPLGGDGGLIQFLPTGTMYHGWSFMESDSELANLRLFVHELKGSYFDFKRFYAPVERISTVLREERTIKADLAICIAPWDLEAILPRTLMVPREDSHVAILRSTLENINPNGKALFLVPEGRLLGRSGAEMALKKELLNCGWIQAVISLPFGLFQPFMGVKTSLFVLNKAMPKRSPIRFLEAEAVKQKGQRGVKIEPEKTVSAFHAKTLQTGTYAVPMENILEWGYRLDYGFVKNEVNLQLEEEQLPFGEKLVEIKAVLERAKTTASNRVGLPKIMIRDLAEADPLFRIGDEIINSFQKTTSSDQGFRVLEPDQQYILVPRIGAKTKAILIQTNSQMIAVHGNVFCLKAKSVAIELDYLIMELNSTFVFEQLAEKLTGATIPSISLEDYFNIKIRIPSDPKQQRRRVEEFKKASLAVKMEELKLHQKRLGLEQSEHQILAVIGHELRPLISNVRTLSDQIRRYFDKKEASKESVSLQDTVGERYQMSLEHTFGIINENVIDIGTLFDALDALMSVDRKKMKMEVISLAGPNWVMGYHDIAQDLPFCLILTGEGFVQDISLIHKKISVDRSLFKLVITNIIRNAQVHGFEKDANNTIVFFTSVFKKDDGTIWVGIDCLNDGKPFPPDFSLEEFTKLGGSLGKTKGTGIGGFLINRIIENFDGELRLLDQEEIDFDIQSIKSSNWHSDSMLKHRRPFKVGLRIELPYCDEEIENLD